jgi:hypothetical protein
MQEPFGLHLLNGLSRGLPFWTWQRAYLLKPREWMGRLLGMGNIKFAGVMPSGHFGILMPQRIYYIKCAQVELDGVDLGQPTTVSPNPTIGDVPLPARGIFAIGQAYWEILDEEEYHRTRRELAVSEP